MGATSIRRGGMELRGSLVAPGADGSVARATPGLMAREVLRYARAYAGGAMILGALDGVALPLVPEIVLG